RGLVVLWSGVGSLWSQACFSYSLGRPHINTSLSKAVRFGQPSAATTDQLSRPNGQPRQAAHFTTRVAQFFKEFCQQRWDFVTPYV
ncbi:MAG TPA: hypothetical protein VFE46_10735, partial [Pirellulales bacterium]|nr:hypothetical protein [Pirellulales bacterium]